MKSDIYKIEEFDAYRAEGFYQLPILKKENYIPKDIVGFNEAMSYRGDRSKVGVHFYFIWMITSLKDCGASPISILIYCDSLTVRFRRILVCIRICQRP